MKKKVVITLLTIALTASIGAGAFALGSHLVTKIPASNIAAEQVTTISAEEAKAAEKKAAEEKAAKEAAEKKAAEEKAAKAAEKKAAEEKAAREAAERKAAEEKAAREAAERKAAEEAAEAEKRRAEEEANMTQTISGYVTSISGNTLQVRAEGSNITVLCDNAEMDVVDTIEEGDDVTVVLKGQMTEKGWNAILIIDTVCHEA